MNAFEPGGRVRVDYPDSPIHGCNGEIEMMYYQIDGWPGDLLYVRMADGPHRGKLFRLFEGRCKHPGGDNA